MQSITVSVTEASQALSLGRTSIYNLINKGSLETIKVGRRRLIKTASIQRLLEDAQ